MATTVTKEIVTRHKIGSKSQAKNRVPYEYRYGHDLTINAILYDVINDKTTIKYSYLEYDLSELPEAVGTFELWMDLSKELNVEDNLKDIIYCLLPEDARFAITRGMAEGVWSGAKVEWPKSPVKVTVTVKANRDAK